MLKHFENFPDIPLALMINVRSLLKAAVTFNHISRRY
jgi:hypothetical protein